jgi:alkyl hydroperoxide reductase subunit AhpC
MRYLTKKRKAASERARRMAKRRWELDRQRRERLAAQDPIFTGLQIVRRIVVIDREQIVRECVIYAGDSFREAQRKTKRVLRAMDCNASPRKV